MVITRSTVTSRRLPNGQDIVLFSSVETWLEPDPEDQAEPATVPDHAPDWLDRMLAAPLPKEPERERRCTCGNPWCGRCS